MASPIDLMDQALPDVLWVTVDVTQADIDMGRAGDCRNCPFALALRRALGALGMADGPGTWVKAFGDYCEVWPLTGGVWASNVPLEVTQFIYRVDTGRDGEPTPFRCELRLTRQDAAVLDSLPYVEGA